MNRNEYSPHLPPPLITQNPDEALAEDERGRTSQPIRAPLHRTCRARPNERLPQREEKHERNRMELVKHAGADVGQERYCLQAATGRSAV